MDPTQLTMDPTRLTKQIEYAQKEKEIMRMELQLYDLHNVPTPVVDEHISDPKSVPDQRAAAGRRVEEVSRDTSSTSPKKRSRPKTNTSKSAPVALVVPKREICTTSSGKKYQKYKHTTIYNDKDTWKKITCHTEDEVYDQMKKEKSHACMRFGKSNTYILKSPETKSHIKSPNGELVKRRSDQGGDYDSIIKNLKSNATAQKKNCYTFVIKKV